MDSTQAKWPPHLNLFFWSPTEIQTLSQQLKVCDELDRKDLSNTAAVYPRQTVGYLRPRTHTYVNNCRGEPACFYVEFRIREGFERKKKLPTSSSGLSTTEELRTA